MRLGIRVSNTWTCLTVVNGHNRPIFIINVVLRSAGLTGPLPVRSYLDHVERVKNSFSSSGVTDRKFSELFLLTASFKKLKLTRFFRRPYSGEIII